MNTFTRALFRAFPNFRPASLAAGLTLLLLGAGADTMGQTFKATLAGASEVPAVNTAATGSVEATLTGTQLVLTGSFSGLSSDLRYNAEGTMPFTHIHLGYAGQNGGILIDLMPTVNEDKRGGTFPAASNTFNLTAEQVESLNKRQLYVNVHSVTFPAGELRGQLLPNADHYLGTMITGLSEVPANASPGTGRAVVEVVGNRVTLSGTFSGLSSDYTNSHLHIGAPGVNGGVKVPLTPTLAADNRGGIFEAARNISGELAAADLAELLAGNFYLNVHSVTLPGGELRGQMLPLDNRFPTATAITSPVSGATITVEGPRDTPFRAEWSASTDPNANPLVYIWQLSAAENFSQILVSQNVGNNTVFPATFGTLDDLLVAAGVPVGVPITVYHRALASDGSLISAPATPASVTLTRGTVTSLREEVARNFSFQVYPSPVIGEAQIAVEAAKQGNATLVVADMLGRLVYRQDMTVQNGTNRFPLDLGRQEAGMYLVQIAVEGQPLPTRKILKR